MIDICGTVHCSKRNYVQSNRKSINIDKNDSCLQSVKFVFQNTLSEQTRRVCATLSKCVLNDTMANVRAP